MPSSRPLHFSVLVQSNRLSTFQFVQLLWPKPPFFSSYSTILHCIPSFLHYFRPHSFRIVPLRNKIERHRGSKIYRQWPNKTDYGFSFIATLQQVPIAPFGGPYRDTRVKILICTSGSRGKPSGGSHR